MYDLIIKNGLIIDGTGKAGYYSDIGIKEDRIVEISDLSNSTAKREIDATGRIVSPGFIDIHSHSDWRIFSALETENVIRQGITTEVTGQCGDSPFPIVDDKAQEIREYILSQNIDGKKLNWNTTKEFFCAVETNGIPHNIVPLVGHGTIRLNVLGYEDRNPTKEESKRMNNLVEEAMKSGAFGISTGFPYPPGSFADTQEVIDLCKIVSKYNGVYTTHLRSQGAHLMEAIEEAIEIGENAKIKVDISHLKSTDRENWGKVVGAIETIDMARERGLSIICDVYPYIAASNPLSSEFPRWVHEGGSEKFIGKLKDTTLREKIKNEMPSEENELWELIYISEVKNSEYKNYVGKSINELAKENCKTAFDTACDIIIENNAEVQVIVICMSEEDVKHVLAYDYAAIGADGGIFNKDGYTGHPRAFGTFPAFIGKYTRDMKLIKLENAIRRMTSLATEFMGIIDRGVISEDMYADIVIFDYDNIIDNATYENPGLYPKGIEYVIVNGAIQIDNGIYKSQSCGRLIRKNMQ